MQTDSTSTPVTHFYSAQKIKSIEYFPDGTVKKIEFDNDPPFSPDLVYPYPSPPFKVTCEV